MTNPAEKKLTQTKDGGGDLVLKVEQATKEPPEEGELPVEEAGEEDASDAQMAVNEAMVETVCMVVSKVVVTLTNIPDMAFDDEETEQLKQLWSPLMPAISPMASALIGTVLIVGGKVGIYASKRKELKGEAEKSATGKQRSDFPLPDVD